MDGMMGSLPPTDTLAMTALAAILLIALLWRTRVRWKPVLHSHPHGLRTADNRIILQIAFPGGPSETTYTVPIDRDCKCRGCKSYRRWKSESR